MTEVAVSALTRNKPGKILQILMTWVRHDNSTVLSWLSQVSVCVCLIGRFPSSDTRPTELTCQPALQALLNIWWYCIQNNYHQCRVHNCSVSFIVTRFELQLPPAG